jgi:hypothetical protein
VSRPEAVVVLPECRRDLDDTRTIKHVREMQS